MLDLRIINATIVDGTGEPSFLGSIDIQDGKIVNIDRSPNPSDSSKTQDTCVIDADKQVVCPGFIDPHTHSDWNILRHPKASSSLLMGVTTEMGGNCGGSMAPWSPSMEKELARSGIEVDEHPETLDDFFNQMESRGIGNNQGTYVGQGAIRGYVMGNATRFPTEEERALMRHLTKTSLQMGAFGMSTGRAYVPGCHAGFKEIVELTQRVADHDALYTAHIADQWANVHRATREVLKLGERTGCAVHVAHQKVVGKDNWGRSPEVLSILEEGLEMGIDITADVYPYAFSAVMRLTDILPPHLKANNESVLREMITHPEGEARIRRVLKENPTYVTARLGSYGVVHCSESKRYEGLDIGEIAAEHKTDIPGAVHYLLKENQLDVKIAGIMAEDDIRTILAHPQVMIGSDSSLRDAQADQDKCPRTSSIHPREYGTYPRVLGKYVREEGLLTLEEAIHKMTGMPAERLALPDRGRIHRGFWADLVIFDPEIIRDRATIVDPFAPPVGISHVLVNGVITVEENDVLDPRAGQVLRDYQGRTLY